MKKLLTAALAMTTLTITAQAACSGTSCIGVDVTRLYMTNAGTLYIGTSGEESALNCTSPANVFLSVKDSDVGKNAIYSTLLTAKTTKTPVTIGIQAGTPDCRVLYVSID